MVDLAVEMAGLKLKNPLIVGAGPNTKNLPIAISCMKGGFGAIVVRSLHMQYLHQRLNPVREFWRVLGAEKDFTKDLYSFQSTAAPVQRINEKAPLGWGGAARIPSLEEWTEEVAKITRAAKGYDCVVIASIGWCGSNLSTEELWRAEAKAMAEAGVDAIQLHTAPSPATEPGRYLMLDPKRYLEMPIRAAKEASGLPVFPKIAVDCCDTVGTAVTAQKAGADGVVPVTRWLSVTIDMGHEKEPVWRGPGIGGPWSVPIMNGLIFRIRNAHQPVNYIFKGSSEQFPNAVPVTLPIIPSGGVRTGADVLGYLVAGANAAEICAQVILEGPQMASRITKEMSLWMAQKGYKCISEFQGTLRLLEHAEAKNIPQWLAVVDKDLCNACETCIRACPNEAICLDKDTAAIDADYCEGCRTCYYVCPTGAISLKP
jgi:dihydroorotate dehydrogenase/Pyruvate/2-oxoacid:ferredoxin oxidoreductase delta subunit